MLKAHHVALGIHTDLRVHKDKAACHYFFGPDNDAHNGSSLHCPKPLKPKGVHYRKVAVNGDAAEETHTDIDVLIQEDATNFAQQLIIGPIVMLQNILKPKRQRKYVEQVCYSQIAKVDTQFIPSLDL